MTVKLLTEHHLEFLSLKEAAHARLSLHMSKCHIVGNNVSPLYAEKQIAISASAFTHGVIKLLSIKSDKLPSIISRKKGPHQRG